MTHKQNGQNRSHSNEDVNKSDAPIYLLPKEQLELGTRVLMECYAQYSRDKNDKLMKHCLDTDELDIH